MAWQSTSAAVAFKKRASVLGTISGSYSISGLVSSITPSSQSSNTSLAKNGFVRLAASKYVSSLTGRARFGSARPIVHVKAGLFRLMSAIASPGTLLLRIDSAAVAATCLSLSSYILIAYIVLLLWYRLPSA